MSDFIDRAKLEAEAYERWPKRWASTSDEVYRPDDPVRDPERDAFLAGAAAYAALLDAETTEEWGVVRPSGEGESFFVADESGADLFISYHPSSVKVSRRVTPWLPSEGGEKRG